MSRIKIEKEEDFPVFIKAAGGLHDALIKQYRYGNDQLYLVFDCCGWGIIVEIWFFGNVAFDNISSTAWAESEGDASWFRGYLFKKNDIIYLTSESISDVSELNQCDWFCGKKMEYRIVQVSDSN